MAGSTTLREYLVKLGWKIDEQSYRNFQASMDKTAKGAAELSRALIAAGKATVVGLTATAFGLHKVAEGLAGMHYAAQRTSSTVRELSLLQFGFQQIGLSADQATASVEALATARRLNPGANALLVNWGITTQDNAQAFTQLLVKMRGMAPYIRAQYAQIFGLDESVINQVELNGGQFSGAMQRRAAQFQKEGFNPDEAARKAVEFERKWNEAKAQYTDMAQTIAVKLLPYAERFINFLERAADWLGKVDKATGGWVTRLGAVAAVLLPILTAFKLLGGFKILGGLGSMLVGGAAAGGEAAAGGGLLALIGPAIPVIVAAVLATAALAGVAWIFKHPEETKKWFKDQDAQAHEIGDKLWNSGKDAVNNLAKRDDFVGSLAKFIGNNEGYRDKIYKDVAGKATVGWGHLVRAGEDFSHASRAQLDALFGSDLQQSMRDVLSMVKVPLNQNQLKALVDHDFQFGGEKLRTSSLLKKLNAGDYAGAAHEFERWNKFRNSSGVLVPSKALTDRAMRREQLFQTPTDKSVTVTVKSDFNISSTDPKGAAAEIDSKQRGTFADITRNFAPAFQ